MARHITILGKKRHVYGCRPSPRDLRDDTYRFQTPHFLALRLLTEYDPRALAPSTLPRVEDQETLGSCVGHGWSSGCEMRLRTLAVSAGKAPGSVPELSRLAVYYHGRVNIEGGDPSDDSGMFVRSGAKALQKFGTPVERLWPYDTTKFDKAPPPAAEGDAQRRQILSYHLISTLNDALYALQQGQPVIGGFSVPVSIGDPATEKSGVIKLPDSRGIEGGHCVLFVGFDRRRKVFIFQNSWSTAWGDKGYGYLPFDFWKRGLLTDVWTLQTLEDGAAR